MVATYLSLCASGLVIFISKYSWYLLTLVNLAAFLCEHSNVADFLEEDILVDFILTELIRFSSGPLRCSQGPASEL